jgi:hypothetical protein
MRSVHARSALVFGVLALQLGAVTPTVAQEGGPQSVERLTLEFESGAFSLVSRQVVQKVLPPSDSLPSSATGVSGFFYELRDGEGGVRYRRIIGDPVRLFFEGPDPDSGSPLPARVEDIPAHGSSPC